MNKRCPKCNSQDIKRMGKDMENKAIDVIYVNMFFRIQKDISLFFSTNPCKRYYFQKTEKQNKKNAIEYRRMRINIYSDTLPEK